MVLKSSANMSENLNKISENYSLLLVKTKKNMETRVLFMWLFSTRSMLFAGREDLMVQEQVLTNLFRRKRRSGQPTPDKLRRSGGTKQHNRYRHDKQKGSYRLGRSPTWASWSSYRNWNSNLVRKITNLKNTY
jgi:hypothetical protein